MAILQSLNKEVNIHRGLIIGCKNQDRKCQSEIYSLYHKAMYNTSLRIIKDPHLAEDIMHDAFISAFEKMDLFNVDKSFGAWLKKIVINKSINEINRKKAELFEAPTFVNEVSENSEEASPVLIKEQVKKAIMELADGYRIILSLYLLEGYDHDEIGKVLKIKASTSRSQLTRAKQKLKELLVRNDEL